MKVDILPVDGQACRLMVRPFEGEVMATIPTDAKHVFGPDEREGKWWLFAYVGGLQKEWGPYATEAFANGARAGLEKLFAEPEKPVDGKPPAPRKKSKDDD